jgi:hypothetical protein
MMLLLGAIADWSALRDVVLASLVAVIGVTVAFSFAILGATRLVETRRDGRTLEAGVYGLLVAVALTISVAAVVFGLVEMMSK